MRRKILFCFLDVMILGFFGWKLIEQGLVLIRWLHSGNSVWEEWPRLLILVASVLVAWVFVVILGKRIARIVTDIRINKENK